MKNLDEIRVQLDEIDEELVALYCRRMALMDDVAAYKKENHLPVYDPARERKKALAMAQQARSIDPAAEQGAPMLYQLLSELGKVRQQAILAGEDPLLKQIEQAVETTDKVFPQSAMVACQGVEGAYAQIACTKLFQLPDILYFRDFEGVFAAIDKGLCRYGVLPLENSTAGSVNRIYDLMMQYDFRIVRSLRVKVDHSLLVKKGVKKQQIREIFSHEQAIRQCAGFLAQMPGVKVTAVANTAQAAKMVAESDRDDVAALSSAACAQLYGLERLAQSVQDQGNNYTRFICITNKTEIYPGADRTSVMMTLAHRPGSLYQVLSRINALGVNLVKLESRPLPDRDFEFMFYFDLETPVYSPAFLQLIGALAQLGETFRYLGSYSELV